MKKKITLVLVMILLVVLLATVFVGCDQIFQKNETRDATQVVATISYNGQTSYIYKFELEQSFNNYAYYYTYYYGMSYEESADYILKTLAQQKLLVLFATEQICNDKGVAVTSDIGSLLTKAELNHAIVEVNDNLLESLKTIVENAITEDNYNAGTDEEEEEEEEIADDAKTIYVKFNSQGGSDVEKQQLKAGQKADEPTEPTYDGYKFYGWYEDKGYTTKVDFSKKKFTETTTLFAKWVEYVEPRTVKEEEEEEDDYDPEDNTVELSDTFFSEKYQQTLYAEFEDEDFVSDMKVAEGEDFEKVLKAYISDGVATLKKNMTTNLYKNSYEEAYNYYLNAQYETIIVEKYERLVGESVAVPTEADVLAEYDRLVQSNKETYSKSTSSYESALKSSLSTTYYNNFTAKAKSAYGFVNNILLKLSDDQVEALEQMLKENPSNKKAVEIERNRMIADMEVYVSNPSYYNGEDTTKIDKENEETDIELVDPMTDPNNKYNDVDANGNHTGIAKDTTYEKEGGNNYDALISFGKNAETNKYEITYNATEAPNMAYLLKKVKVFGTNGIIDQIQKTFDAVNNATDLNEIQKAYWLRQVATEWLYLVGDDSGSLSTSSNNNGLGYLITPEGEDTSYLEDFTTYARNLIKQGTGSYKTVTGDVNVESVVGADGELTHNMEGYVVADSFIESGTTSGGYAGVFVLLCSYKVWDEDLYAAYTEPSAILITDADGGAGILPTNYILTFAEDDEDIQTIYEVIYESLLESKKEDAYSIAVNTMGAKYNDSISYNKKVYKSLYEDLDE